MKSAWEDKNEIAPSVCVGPFSYFVPPSSPLVNRPKKSDCKGLISSKSTT
jgi:hypothetical protein